MIIRTLGSLLAAYAAKNGDMSMPELVMQNIENLKLLGQLGPNLIFFELSWDVIDKLAPFYEPTIFCNNGFLVIDMNDSTGASLKGLLSSGHNPQWIKITIHNMNFSGYLFHDHPQAPSGTTLFKCSSIWRNEILSNCPVTPRENGLAMRIFSLVPTTRWGKFTPVEFPI